MCLESLNKNKVSTNAVPFVFICDDQYSMVTSVAITSLIENMKSESFYEIYVITTDISDETKQKIMELDRENAKISFVYASTEKYSDAPMKEGYRVATVAALLKFDITWLLPHLDKVIYIDGDVLIRGDLSDLFFDTKLENEYAAVVIDSGKLYTNRYFIKMTNDYFNSGFMILNLTQMRQDNISEILFEEKMKDLETPLMDQDIFNTIFIGRVKLLPIRYNFLYVNLLRAYSNNLFQIKDLNKMYNSDYTSLQNVLKDAVIIHFASKDKPWKYYDTPLADEWYLCFLRSPYKITPMFRNSLELLELKSKRENKKRDDFFKAEIDRILSSKTYRLGNLFASPYRLAKEVCKRFLGQLKIFSYILPVKNAINKENRKEKIIVSLTSYSVRIKYVSIVIGIMLRQTMKPDRVILYLSETEAGNKLPLSLRIQKLCGLEISYVGDLKPHTKYYYSMSENPEDIIITVDDDVLYEKDLIEVLYDSYQQNRNAVSAARVHKITFYPTGKICSYSKWIMRYENTDVPSMDLLATGVGGVLYPPGCLHKEVFNLPTIKEICFFADDLWLKTMEVMNNTPVVWVGSKRHTHLQYIKNTQEIGLFNQNVGSNRNDEQLKNILEKYNEFYGTADTLTERMRGKFDYLIVGAGLFGAVFAYEATKKGKSCLVIDKRPHIAGNVYTENVNGINVHKYGAHIFHTNDKEVWDYVNQFAEFNHYINSPIAVYKDELYNLPFNMNTFSKLWGVKTPTEAMAIIEKQRAELILTEIKNLEEQALFLAGRDIYEKLIKGYIEKQWGEECKNLPAFILNRRPFRFTYDNNYFNDNYQGIPIGGYTGMIEKMLNGCNVLLNTDYFDLIKKNPEIAKKTVYTGAIDEFFEYKLGALQYRSLRFETDELPTPNYQGNAVVNYTEREVPYTRIIEHKHFEHSLTDTTIITREYPTEWKKGYEPYYPLNDDKNNELYLAYKDMAERRGDVIFGGRLGQYKYYNMDEIISAAWLVVREELW